MAAGLVALLCAGWPAGAQPAADLLFVDVTDASGIAFERIRQVGLYRVENIHDGGVAVADVDGDGFEDVYFNQAALEPGAIGALTTPGNRLFRNNGDGTFTDWTRQSGLDTRAMSHGAAFADYDNDGDPDLFVSNYGPSQLFQNDGTGKFTDVTAEAGILVDHCFWPCWSSGAAWGDLDADGWLDLYVTNFKQVGHVYGLPSWPWWNAVPGARNLLFMSDGDGTFTELAGPLGVADPGGTGWQPGLADYDNDGDLDIFVANDMSHNRLFRNDGDRVFVDVTDEAGVPTGFTSMGLVWFDLDNDLDLDLVSTEYRQKPTTLLINDGDGTFTDESGLRGLHTSLDVTGWGANAFDYDHDGDLDLFLANGDADNLNPLDVGNNLYENVGGTFVDRTDQSQVWGGTFARGSAVFDMDHDGDDDLVVSSSEGPAFVFANTAPKHGHALQVRLESTTANRDAIGATVYVTTPTGTTMRPVVAGDSFEATNSLWLTFGLGAATEADVRVVWPHGNEEHHTLHAGQGWWLREGHGVVPDSSRTWSPIR